VTEENQNTFSQDSRPLGRDARPGPFEYEADVLDVVADVRRRRMGNDSMSDCTELG
jgi:hypothetical protein